MIPKFRAWHKKEKKVYLVAKIDFGFLKVICYEEGSALITKEFDFNDIILMQSTGLKDKNGKEIFEGDIVKGHNKANICKVKFFMGGFRFGWKTFGGILAENMDEEWEVIGNIYENPEMTVNKSFRNLDKE